MTIKREGLGNPAPPHQVEAGDIHQTELPPTSKPPSRNGSLKPILANGHHLNHRKNHVAEIQQSCSPQAPLN